MKVKANSLTMMSEIVKTAIRTKEIKLYAQPQEFAERNLVTKFVTKIGDNIFFLDSIGSVIFHYKDCDYSNYCKDDEVELE